MVDSSGFLAPLRVVLESVISNRLISIVAIELEWYECSLLFYSKIWKVRLYCVNYWVYYGIKPLLCLLFGYDFSLIRASSISNRVSLIIPVCFQMKSLIFFNKWNSYSIYFVRLTHLLQWVCFSVYRAWDQGTYRRVVVHPSYRLSDCSMHLSIGSMVPRRSSEWSRHVHAYLLFPQRDLFPRLPVRASPLLIPNDASMYGSTESRYQHDGGRYSHRSSHRIQSQRLPILLCFLGL